MSTVLAKVRVFPAQLGDMRFMHLDKELYGFCTKLLPCGARLA